MEQRNNQHYSHLMTIVRTAMVFACFFVAMLTKAQKITSDSIVPTSSLVTTGITKYQPTAADSLRHRSKFQKFISSFDGITIGADIAGPVQYLASDFGTLEGALKISIKNKFFPTFEAGLGRADITDENTDIKYTTTAPFCRIGIDINMLKNKKQKNRLFVGARYGFSTFNYDISGPAIEDPIWGGSQPFKYSNISTTCHWMEICLGVQVHFWGHFHMGWSARYKAKLGNTESRYSSPYYIPGYGTTSSASTWGACYHLIWDIRQYK